MHYNFSNPIQEGVKDGKPFYVVEISEKHKGLVLRKAKVPLAEAKYCLEPYLPKCYTKF